MKRIYYLTRSYLPDLSGGTLMRAAAVRLFQENGFAVTVFTPNYKGKNIEIVDNVIYFPFYKTMSFSRSLERVGIYEDYLDPWVEGAVDFLSERVFRDDIVFATSGGELANIKMGSLLKKIKGCKYVVNFRDPLDFSLVNGLRSKGGFHVSRERQEAQYLANADLIITSSRVNQASLEKKYPDLVNKITNNYYGYISKVPLGNRSRGRKLRIAYSGAFTRTQSPEILFDSLEKQDGVELFFIGNFADYKPVQNIVSSGRAKGLAFLPRKQYLDFMRENIDVGFVSLVGDYWGACVPSKIYELVNLGIPILGALPVGDAKDIINNNGYGIACHYADLNSLKDDCLLLLDQNRYRQFQDKILVDRDDWAMEQKIKEVVSCLNMV